MPNNTFSCSFKAMLSQFVVWKWFSSKKDFFLIFPYTHTHMSTNTRNIPLSGESSLILNRVSLPDLQINLPCVTRSLLAELRPWRRKTVSWLARNCPGEKHWIIHSTHILWVPTGFQALKRIQFGFVLQTQTDEKRMVLKQSNFSPPELSEAL